MILDTTNKYFGPPQISFKKLSFFCQELIAPCTTGHFHIADGINCLQALCFFSLAGPFCLHPSLFVDERFTFHNHYMLQYDVIMLKKIKNALSEDCQVEGWGVGSQL